ncbi:hypothetical protein N9363_09495, partial [Paracoccaceae bacterium]|nr:hypothetical protein [Paracoccaceae bacterium]
GISGFLMRVVFDLRLLSVQKNITIGCDKRRQIVKNVAYRKQAWRKIMPQCRDWRSLFTVAMV